MLSIIALIALIVATLTLIIMCIIDLKIRILPDELVLSFLCCAIVFHISTIFQFVTPMDILIGVLAGGGSLFLIRLVANRIYQTDTLGLGDVKLMGAAGALLGASHIMLAITLGAIAGILHGIIYALYLARRQGRMPNLSSLALPAGPGFAAGIVITACLVLHDFPYMVAQVIAQAF